MSFLSAWRHLGNMPPALVLFQLAIGVALSHATLAETPTSPITASRIDNTGCQIRITPVDNPAQQAAIIDQRSQVAARCGSRPPSLAWLSPAVNSGAGAGTSSDTGYPSASIGYALPVTMAARGAFVSVSVSNPGDHTVYLKSDIREWHQDVFGQDVFVSSRRAIISPQRIVMHPGETRELNVQMPTAIDRELAFSIILQQVPDDRGGRPVGKVSTITQMLPAFSEPAQKERATLRARRIDPEHVLITNDGGRRARLVDITSNGKTVAPGFVGYALAYSSVLVPLNAPIQAGTVEIDTDQGHRVVEVR